MADSNPMTPPVATKTLLFEDAYERLLPEYQALDESELTLVNIDIPAAVATALGVVPKVRALRPRIAWLPELDINLIDNLELYALGMSHAHALHLITSAPRDSLRSLADEGARLRAMLVDDTKSLARHGWLDAERLSRLKGPSGYNNLAVDLQMLATLLMECWPAIEGKCSVSLGEIQRAESFARQILTMFGRRGRGRTALAASLEMRARAFTLFMRAYDQTRRAVGYLNWGEDGEVVPSLFVRRWSRKRKKREEAATEGGAETHDPRKTEREAEATEHPASVATEPRAQSIPAMTGIAPGFEASLRNSYTPTQ